MTLFKLTDIKPKVDSVATKIKRLRRIILVHSCIYYHYGENLVDDAQFDKWGWELKELEKQNPEIAATVEFAKEFKGYAESNTTSGYDLPYTLPEIMRKAEQLLQYNNKEEKKK